MPNSKETVCSDKRGTQYLVQTMLESGNETKGPWITYVLAGPTPGIEFDHGSAYKAMIFKQEEDKDGRKSFNVHDYIVRSIQASDFVSDESEICSFAWNGKREVTENREKGWLGLSRR